MSSPTEPSSFVLTRRLADGTVEWIPLEIPQRVQASAGEHYALIDRAAYEAPETLVARRRGDDLVVEAQGDEVLVLGGFFAAPDVAFYPTTDIASGAGPFSAAPLTADSPAQTASSDGEPVIWSAEPQEAEQVARSTEADGGGSPLLWGGLAAGGLGVALAAGGSSGGSGGGGNGGGGDDGGGGDGGGDEEPDTTAPEITSAGDASPIDENSGAGQVVYTATATDEGPVTWSLDSSGDAAAFEIDAGSGAVTLVEDPDFENRSSYTFTVVASDAAGNTSSQTVTLAVNDIDEAGPDIISGGTATAIDENSGPDQTVYTAEVDEGPVTWSLQVNGNGSALSIDPDTGAVTLLDDPDHEDRSSYAFTVVATDADGNRSAQAVTLAINDLDEVAPSITSGDTAAAVDENSGAGQVVYTVTSTDDDDISTGSTTYSLAGSGDGDAFSIDADTGAVTLDDDPDFESQSSYTFTVVATDAAGNSSEQTVSLAINDVDDAVRVDAVELTGADGAENGILNAGDTVSVTVTMSDDVDVDTSGGTPRIALGMGGTTVYAEYASGSGSSSLIFEYTITADDNDTNGISISPNSLDPNGGSITDTSGGEVNLRHGPVVNDDAFLVDNVAPTLSGTSPADEADDVSVDDDIVLTFGEDVQIGSGNITISNGSDTRTIDVTDDSQVSVSGNEVIIDPSSDLAPLSAYSVQVDDGAITDAAGNPFAGISDTTTLNFETALDTTVVVFDLVGGASSDHSGRTFDDDVSYDIYVRVDGNDAELNTDDDDSAGSWGSWSGAANLGSDDRIILVGNGIAVEGPDGPLGMEFGVSQVSVDPTAVAWQDLFGGTAAAVEGGTLTRRYAGDTDSVTLFDTALPSDFLGGQGGELSTMYALDLPGSILTTQGLV